MVHSSTIDQLINLTGGKFPNCSVYVHEGVITRELYEARKAERQNKPSWGECPDWAHYVAQDANGDWHWFSHTPFIGVANGWNALGRFGFSQSGKVIGDWRNTLEQRPNHIGESCEKGDVDAAIEAMRDIRTTFANRAVSKFKSQLRYIDQHPCGLSKVEVTVEPDIDFEWLANQFDDADDINAVWALRDKLHHKNKPKPSPELSFHLANASNELQASAKLLTPESHLLQSITGVIAAIQAIREAV